MMKAHKYCLIGHYSEEGMISYLNLTAMEINCNNSIDTHGF